jgi:NAD-dependent SIR2 family protein deacetylase
MSNEQKDELFSVSCIYCNEQVFQFSKNMLETERKIVLECPKCGKLTKVYLDSESGVSIGKY